MNTFDQVADQYKEALEQNLRFIPGGVDYYYENRAKLARCMVPRAASPQNILDFGGGIGLALPHLKRLFPLAKIFTYDISFDSMTQATAQNPFAYPLSMQELQIRKFDMIFVAGVIHHVQPQLRREILKKLRDSLSKNGIICIFELNPLNPVTRRLVACCPFDEDASLCSKRHLTSFINEIEGLTVFTEGYTVFFPPILKFLRPVERLLRWLPAGAQYFLGVKAT